MDLNYQNICQSCGMPLEKKDQFGTNHDGSENKEYCIHCYKFGKFADPDISMDQMIDKCVAIMVQIKKISMKKARDILEKSIPNLKRWKR